MKESNQASLNVDSLASVAHATDFRVFVKTLTGASMCMNVCRSDTSMGLKACVAETTRIPVEFQSLVFQGEALDHTQPLASYNIVRDSQIWLVSHLPGGMHHGGSEMYWNCHH